MNITFYKYQGTGNDFVIIDNRDGQFDSNSNKIVSFLCDRKFGIGADGLMLLERHDRLAFTMRYFNSDGNEATMCGNGGRCIAAFAVHTGAVKNPKEFEFMAIDGSHKARYSKDNVSLKMTDVKRIVTEPQYLFLDTGSPHYVTFVENNSAVDVVKEGRKVRYLKKFEEIGGTNVNFIEQINETSIKMRTYERGVENETLSCGTGAVASAISTAIKQGFGEKFNVEVRGGELQVEFKMDEKMHPSNIWLTGPAEFVFKGEIAI